MSKSVMTLFSSSSLMVSELTLRSLIYFEIILYGVRECPNIHFHVAVRVSQHLLLRRRSFLYCTVF